MKVLVQNPFMHAGGAENRQRWLMQALVRRPDIDEVHFMFVGAESQHQIEASGKMHFWQLKPGHTEDVTKEIIKQYDVDIVQLHNNQLIGVDGIALAQKVGLPTIWVMHDFWPLCWQRFFTKVWQADSEELCYEIDPDKCATCVGDYYSLLTKKQREVVNNCDVGIVPSKRIRDIFYRNNFLKDKMEVVEPWIDLSLFKPEASIQKKDWQVLFAGNYIPHKGINVLLKAWDIVQRRLPMSNLIAQGDARCKNETIGLAKKLKLTNVSLIETVPQEHLKRLYIESAITVFPSIWEETIGLIWVESLACGTPVICSHTGSIPELLKYGGETFEPRNHVELAETIIDFLLSPSKRNAYAQEGHRYVHQAFSPERAAEDFMKIYTALELKKYGNVEKIS